MMSLVQITTCPNFCQFLGLVLLLALLYGVSIATYRLYLSPIAQFPGPLLARLTFFYQFYYDWFYSGQYYLEVEKMHMKYGPVVRMTPTELHIRDPLFHNQLYVSGAVRKSDSYPRFTLGTGVEDITFPVTAHDRHRAVRSRLNPFFSRASMTRLEP
ncbi:hypothetical protein BDW42DRAFT_26739 [Aspergillus taichungensis]|uniref:Cytochrome P450 n=1 Tax=Aspergillus taichungensis TaxID=482145 RepID=A0A2J5HGN0_9EURO|nr:hypothetical protein BDW42DRAFT_26739 [Aspergillus taichungensis]